MVNRIRCGKRKHATGRNAKFETSKDRKGILKENKAGYSSDARQCSKQVKQTHGATGAVVHPVIYKRSILESALPHFRYRFRFRFRQSLDILLFAIPPTILEVADTTNRIRFRFQNPGCTTVAQYSGCDRVIKWSSLHVQNDV